jgi:tetratricopeptide (TPR) repeat protein
VAAAPASPAPVFARQQGHYGDRAPRRLVDPEQVLASYPWRISPDTLREVIDEPEELLAVRDRLTDKLEYAERDAVRARLLSLRAVVSRVLGDLDFALADGRAALAHAETTGELRRTSIVRARLAHVLRWRGEFAEADQLFEEANSVELPDRLRAEMYELAGRSAFDQGRLLEAVNRFEQALDLRRSDDDQMVSRIELALDTVARAAREAGWGPYPRGIDEILQRPSRSETWPGGSYTQARPFSDGLAWVSRDADGGWFAVDGQDRVIVPGGFDDVGPFRRGVAPVRRGAGWGAIDRHGRIVVQPKYRRFVTALVGGRRVDGFTEEGLAVVDAGDRLGVVDRGGQLVVAPVHAALVIHPVAYLIGDRAGRWGALDRNGDPLIEARHRSEAEVVHEIDRLLSDTRPVL